MSGSEEDVPQQDEDFTIDTTDAGASTTFPMQAGLIRKGGHIVINGRPCKVADISTSKTGKHGHAKANIVGIDIFTDRKYEDICPTSHNVDVPHVTKREYPVLDISDDGFCSLMCDDGSTKDDLRVPAGELGDKIREEFTAGKNVVVNVTRAMDEEHILAFKLAADA